MNDETRDAVRQWKAKAESDWTTVQILLDSERCPAEAEGPLWYRTSSIF
jgi:hypothetical protein